MGAISLEVSKRAQLEIPELFPDETWVEVQLSSLEAGLRNVARTIAEGTDPSSIELPLETVAYAGAAARQGFAVTSLMRLYQLSQAVLWEELQRELSVRAASREELTDAHGLVAAWIFGYIDTAMGLAIDAYTEERERWLRSAAARQAEMIDAILSGRQTEAAVAGAAIRYELEREHIAVAAWLEEAPKDVDAAIPLEAAIAEVGEALGAGGMLTQPRGLLATFGWVSTAGTFDPKLLDGSLLAGAAKNGVRLAIGEAGRSIRGFRESHEGAENARRVAVLQGRPPGSVTRYARVALAALGSADRAQAQAFVIRQLGPLTAPDETSLRLVATLRAYLDEHASRSRAAKRLGVHENTISYRVRQAEEILGRSVDEETLELHVALVLAPVVLDA
jgi:DNA-binding PucR family transcriptional regulator